MLRQRERIFFGPKDPYLRFPPTERAKQAQIEKVFSSFVGNEAAIRKLKVAVYGGLGKENHLARELAFAIFGPSSAGKTTLAHLVADALGTPFVEISPRAIKTLADFLNTIEKVLN